MEEKKQLIKEARESAREFRMKEYMKVPEIDKGDLYIDEKMEGKCIYVCIIHMHTHTKRVLEEGRYRPLKRLFLFVSFF